MLPLSIPMDEQSGLLMRIATASVTLCAAMRSSPHFWNWQRRFAKIALTLAVAG